MNKYIDEHFITVRLRLEFGNWPIQVYKFAFNYIFLLTKSVAVFLFAPTCFQISTVLFVCFGQVFKVLLLNSWIPKCWIEFLISETIGVNQYWKLHWYWTNSKPYLIFCRFRAFYCWIYNCMSCHTPHIYNCMSCHTPHIPRVAVNYSFFLPNFIPNISINLIVGEIFPILLHFWVNNSQAVMPRKNTRYSNVFK
jgi:hypothetical protein